MYIDVSQYIVWYWLLVAIIMIVSIYSFLRHKAVLPFMWGITLSIVLVVLHQYIEPFLLGFLAYYNQDWWMFAFMGWVAMVWLIWIILCLYNQLRYKGEVVT